jgi:Tubulin-tyrosine ligase family
MTHNMQFYIFKEGYIRTSSTAFDLNDENPFVHLTNNAVQKFAKDYGTFESGN